MNTNRNDFQPEQITHAAKHEKIYRELYEYEEAKNLVGEAYEALNRFYQKEQRRNKTVKRRRNCWQ